ncbi:MAG: hypothetical protein KIT62_17005 [Cyclobacteriaceae bacterium]|nr:hypothetical protein [Cyclobacteriaceae bacterium]
MFKVDFNIQSMKILRIVSFLAVAAVLSTYMGCKPKGSDPEPLENVQFDKLAKTWKINTVTFNDTDRTAEYTGFQLALGGTKGAPPFSYTTTSRPAQSPWKASGTWEFGSSVGDQIIRDKGVSADELAIEYSVTESTLQLKFTFLREPYDARTEDVKGPWIFNFTL